MTSQRYATRFAPVERPAHLPAWLPGAWVTIAAASVVLVTGLWLGGHGLQYLTLPNLFATSLGRLTGMLGADLLLVQVVLMARVPWLERSFGQDRLARWHRLVGFTSINLILAHVALITLGYAVTAHAGLVRQAWDLVVTYPGMLLATAATAMLVLVAATSIRRARRRLRYESWHLLHLYAYLGVGLAIPHELWTGADLVSSPTATVFWWTAYAVAAGCVLLFRIGWPVWRNLQHQLRVHSVVPEGPGVVSVWLRGTALDRLPVRAGQFFTWRFLTGPGWSRAHPYSLSAAPRDGLLRITVKDLGDGSGLVRHLRPGTRVLIEGPYGALAGQPSDGRPITMFASGVGITPLRALLESLPYRHSAATLVYRARSEADFLFRDELDQLASRRGVRVVYLPGPRAGHGRWAPAGHGTDDRLLRRLVPGIAKHEVYVCGPPPWLAAVEAALLRAGVAPQRVHSEQFSW